MNYGAPSAGRGSARTSERLRPPPTPPTIKKNRPLLPNFPLPPPPQNNDAKPSQRALRSDGGAEVARIADGGGGGGWGGRGRRRFWGLLEPISVNGGERRAPETHRAAPPAQRAETELNLGEFGFFFFNCFFFFPDFFPLDFIFSRFFRFLVFTPFFKNTALISFSFFFPFLLFSISFFFFLPVFF